MVREATERAQSNWEGQAAVKRERRVPTLSLQEATVMAHPILPTHSQAFHCNCNSLEDSKKMQIHATKKQRFYGVAPCSLNFPACMHSG